ncbi:Xanthine and CO dehydrogenases maturation factor, XdhC/CoxF family [hydrothermal vent metagenome]|uniref:Xanthine and CO dehydrogenases maturation factor, XdhC/CoxF family n=1 Tax=hydrothermal vent metagenome TaxID=652676 RepID=A0A3B1CAV7_9ZZZZ
MNLIKKILELQESNKTFVVATVIESKGSAPGKSGFKIIIDSQGNAFGTVGGGEIEFEVIEHSKKIMQSGNNEVKKYLLTKKDVVVEDDITVVPMMCNGNITIFYEVNKMKPEVYIFGGGHVGQALLRILPQLGYHIKLIDNREEFSSSVNVPGADEYTYSDYRNYTDKFEPSENAYLISLTHGHSFDYEILKRIYSRKLNVKYIGVIASRSKSKQLKEKLLEEVGSDLDFSKLHTPIGLKIGGDSADEIALSIAAELQSVRYSKKVIVE